MITKKTLEEIANIHSRQDRERLNDMVQEMARGLDFMDSFDNDRVVTVYGSTKIKRDSRVYNQARKLGQLLAQAGITVATGGGPGIMEAANRGAFEANGRSVGINIFLDILERRNSYTTENIGFNHFFARKYILAHIAQAYIYFPGGYGTLDEFFEMTTLVSTKKIEQKMPMVVVGKTYWASLKKWLSAEAVKEYQTLSADKLKFWTVVDSAEEAFKLVKNIPTRIKRHKSV